MTKEEWEAKERKAQSVVNALDKLAQRYVGKVMGSREIKDQFVYRSKGSDSYYIAFVCDWVMERERMNTKSLSEEFKDIVKKYLNGIRVLIDYEEYKGSLEKGHVAWLREVLPGDPAKFDVPSRYRQQDLQESTGDKMVMKGKALAKLLDIMRAKGEIKEYIVGAGEGFKIRAAIMIGNEGWSYGNEIYNKIEAVIGRYLNVNEAFLISIYEAGFETDERSFYHKLEVYSRDVTVFTSLPQSTQPLQEEFGYTDENMKKAKAIYNFIDKQYKQKGKIQDHYIYVVPSPGGIGMVRLCVLYHDVKENNYKALMDIETVLENGLKRYFSLPNLYVYSYGNHMGKGYYPEDYYQKKAERINKGNAVPVIHDGNSGGV